MPTVSIKNSDLPMVFEHLARLVAWVKPGIMSLNLSRDKAAIEQVTMDVVKQKRELLKLCAVWENDQCKMQKVNGMDVPVWNGDESEATFKRESKEIDEASTIVSLPVLLTEQHVEKIEASLVATSEAPAADFSALFPIMAGYATVTAQ